MFFPVEAELRLWRPLHTEVTTPHPAPNPPPGLWSGGLGPPGLRRPQDSNPSESESVSWDAGTVVMDRDPGVTRRAAERKTDMHCNGCLQPDYLASGEAAYWAQTLTHVRRLSPSSACCRLSTLNIVEHSDPAVTKATVIG